MNMPGFDADLSLGPTIGIYGGNVVSSKLDVGGVSMQQFRGSFFGGRFGTPLMCCSADSHFCITRNVFPFERCKCGQDFDGAPIFICRPPVFSPD